MPQYTPKQIANYWRNYLDPTLTYSSLSEEEKNFITNWINLNRKADGRVSWKDLRNELKESFGILRSENAVKNYWYGKLRKNELIQEYEVKNK